MSRPAEVAEWWALIRLWMGGLFGWLLHPALWLAAGPRRWCAILAATAYAESRYNPSAYNADEGAYGMLQFLDSTWEALVGKGPPDTSNSFDILSPSKQGYYAAKYYQDRILERWSLLLSFGVPYWGFAAWRWEWRHAPGTYSGLTGAWTELKNEQSGLVRDAWFAWTSFTYFLVLAPVVACLGWRRRE